MTSLCKLQSWGRVNRDTKFKREKIQMWEETGQGHYTEQDIPEWERKKIGFVGPDSPFDTSRDFLRTKRQSDAGKNICRIGYTTHFNREGYEWIIAEAARRELMLEADIKSWREKAFGKPQP